MNLGASSSSGGSGNNIRLQWEYLISVYNKTKLDALNVSLTLSLGLGKVPYRRKRQLSRHIRGLETQQIVVETEQEFPREVVKACGNRFQDLLPSELRHLKMVLHYENERGQKYSCSAANNDGAVEVTYSNERQ
jgi:hypothetical protein